MERTEMVEVARSAFNSAYEMCNRETGWTEETSSQDTKVDWRPGEDFGIKRMEGGGDWRAWRVRAEIDENVETVFSIIMDTDNMAKWNNSITQSKMLEQIDESTMLTYQVTSGQRPIVAPRDFVFISRRESRGDVRLAGGCSIETELKPVTKDYIRAWQFPGIMIISPLPDNKCTFTWLQQSQYGGSMPISILNMVFPMAIKFFVSSLRSEVKRLRKKKQKS